MKPDDCYDEKEFDEEDLRRELNLQSALKKAKKLCLVPQCKDCEFLTITSEDFKTVYPYCTELMDECPDNIRECSI